MTRRKILGLLALLLLIDGLFILLHLLYLEAILHDDLFRLDWERSYAEFFQYAKMVVIILLLLALNRRQPAAVHWHWLLLFGYFLLDDAFMIHETVGGILVTRLNLPGLWGARPQDLGELLVYAATGLFFLITLLLTYFRSDQAARRLSHYLLLLMVALLFFGVFLDLPQYMVSDPALFRWLTILEDGGEHLVMSVTVGFLLTRRIDDLLLSDIPG
jgi:hypothetical protein